MSGRWRPQLRDRLDLGCHPIHVAVAVIGIALFSPAIRRQLAEAERDVTSDAYRATKPF